jgi:hypothetical protein
MIEEDVVKEAKRIIEAGQSQNVVLRLLGGVAIAVRCPGAKNPAIARKYPDIDLAGFKKQGRGIRDLFSTLGYLPNYMFNAVRGGSRLMFFDLQNKRRVDIFLDSFEMCHKIDLRDRLTVEPLTLPLADMLATKLQIFQTNAKDVKDIVTILLDHEVGDSDKPDLINGPYLAKLCADDWGIYKTFTIVIGKVLVMIDSFDLTPSQKESVKARLKRISDLIEAEPKSFNWKMRGKVGEKKTWYKLPEDMAE